MFGGLKPTLPVLRVLVLKRSQLGDRFQVCEQSFRRDVLFVGPGYGAEDYVDLGEVGLVAQFLEDAVVEVGLEVESSLGAVLELDVDLVVVEGADLFYIPVHGDFEAGWSRVAVRP